MAARPKQPFSGKLITHKVNLGLPDASGISSHARIGFDQYGQPRYRHSQVFELEPGEPLPQTIDQVERALIREFRDNKRLRDLVRKRRPGKRRITRLVMNLKELSRLDIARTRRWIRDRKYVENEN